MREKVIAFAAKYLIRAILKTCRIEVTGLEKVIAAAEKGPLILMLWHNRLAPLAEILYPLSARFNFAAFVSKSRDGEILSQFVLSYKGGQVIRVPHNGRDKALKVMIETLKKNEAIVMITPDGPKGPIYTLKPGVKFAAEETGAAIIPFSWDASSYFSLSSWDRFRIPKPFTRITAHFGDPLSGNASLETLQNVLQGNP
jgi:lysophospholipid acyltransferase (LPLAT)-like uncharacterized protein